MMMMMNLCELCEHYRMNVKRCFAFVKKQKNGNLASQFFPLEGEKAGGYMLV